MGQVYDVMLGQPNLSTASFTALYRPQPREYEQGHCAWTRQVWRGGGEIIFYAQFSKQLYFPVSGVYAPRPVHW